MVKQNVRPSPVTPTVTHEGAPAFRAPAYSELVLTAVNTFVGEDTYYETAKERTDRLVELVHAATKTNAGQVASFVGDLRTKFFIRGASVLVAVEYLRAGGPNARQVISDALQRPDEPGEALAYWRNTGGTTFPWALRKGVADAAVRLYSERNYLKYGQNDRAMFGFADVIELTHPVPRAPWQANLFRYILDEAHHKDGIERYISRRQEGTPEQLSLVYASHQLGKVPEGERRTRLRSAGAEALGEAGYTWERLSGWLPGGMDAEAWQAVIPTMGVMALLRNLRNFDQVGISKEAQAQVEAKITSAEDVERSRIFPYRVWQAYQAAPSDRWKHALATTLELSAANVTDLSRTLFVIDVSGSMSAPLSQRSKMARYELAALMAMAATRRSTNISVGLFGTNWGRWQLTAGASILREVQGIVQMARQGTLGWGTYGHGAIQAMFDPNLHDRVIVFTDTQMHDAAALTQHVPTIVYFNLAGYAPLSDWGKRRFNIGGFSDAALAAIPEL